MVCDSLISKSDLFIFYILLYSYYYFFVFLCYRVKLLFDDGKRDLIEAQSICLTYIFAFNYKMAL